MIRALLFDVFGTCVNWRAGVAREIGAMARRRGVGGVDAAAVADAWRARYAPQLETVRDGSRPWVDLDVLHRESLDDVLDAHGLGVLGDADRDELTLAWHRLDPWPDTLAGLERLRRAYVIAPVSNGHIALVVAMARRAGIVWDAVLGAELAQSYKPLPDVYLRSVAALGLQPGEAMMVAAHGYDLRAAAACGLRTAFVHRPHEHGPAHTTDPAEAAPAADVTARDLIDLAERLGA